MSGIVGFWNVDGRPADPQVLSRLSRALVHRGPAVQSWTERSTGMACRSLPAAHAVEEPPLASSPEAILVFDGRLDNREEVVASLGDHRDVRDGSSDAALVLSAYRRFEEAFVDRLVGDFALALFDRKRQKLLLARDAIGVRPLYYALFAGSLVFASEIKALLAHPRARVRLDDATLADWVLEGARQTGERTCFQDILSLLPSHVAVITPRQVRIRRYWDFDPSARIELDGFQDYADGFRLHFERAVRRRLRSAGRVAVSVSGGLDSSAILCLAERLGRSCPHTQTVFGLTYSAADHSPSDETRFLREIERCQGLTIRRVEAAPPAVPGQMIGDWRQAIRQAEVPLLDGQWDTTQAMLGSAREQGARVLLTGHWGDQVLADRAYLIDLVRGLAWGTVWAHLRAHARWQRDVPARRLIVHFLRNLVEAQTPAWIVRRLRRLKTHVEKTRWSGPSLRRGAGAPLGDHPRRPPFPTAASTSLYDTVRSSYHVQCLEWSNKVAAAQGIEMAFPFLDRDLLSYLMAIPGEMRAWQGVPKALLREGLRDVLPAAIRGRTCKGDYTHRVNALVRGCYPALRACLGSGALAVRLGYLQVPDTAWMKLRAGLNGDSCTAAWTLLNLLGLELWLQEFVEGDLVADGEPGMPLDLELHPVTAGGTA